MNITKPIQQIGEAISQDLAGSMVKRYNDCENCVMPVVHLIGREILDRILAQPGCVGIRFYQAQNEQFEDSLVYVGVDKDNCDILTSVVVAGDNVQEIPGIVGDRSVGVPPELESPYSWC